MLLEMLIKGHNRIEIKLSKQSEVYQQMKCGLTNLLMMHKIEQ